VRGKVTSMRLRHASHAERENILQQAETYFTHALHYATRLTQPLLILTGGIIASGKSTVAERLAQALDLDLYRSDALRKELAGVEPTSSQRAAYGQGMYSAAARQRVYDAMADLARHALRQGRSVCLDASFAKRAERERLAALAQNAGARVYTIECLAPDAVIRERLRARELSVGTLSDAREDILESFRQDYEPVQDGELTGYVALDTTQDIGACVHRALAAVYRPRSG
jgi:predicted kinase